MWRVVTILLRSGTWYSFIVKIYTQNLLDYKTVSTYTLNLDCFSFALQNFYTMIIGSNTQEHSVIHAKIYHLSVISVAINWKYFEKK